MRVSSLAPFCLSHSSARELPGPFSFVRRELPGSSSFCHDYVQGSYLALFPSVIVTCRGKYLAPYPSCRGCVQGSYLAPVISVVTQAASTTTPGPALTALPAKDRRTWYNATDFSVDDFTKTTAARVVPHVRQARLHFIKQSMVSSAFSLHSYAPKPHSVFASVNADIPRPAWSPPLTFP